MYELIHDDFPPSAGWVRIRNHKRQSGLHRYRWMSGLPVDTPWHPHNPSAMPPNAR